MTSIISACFVVLGKTFQPLVGIHGTSQLIIAAIVYLSIPVVPTALSLFFRSDIPGARDFDPSWTFPLIVFLAASTILFFLTALRFQLLRNGALERLAVLREQGVGIRIKGRHLDISPLPLPYGHIPTRPNSPELGSWIEEYCGWEKDVHDEMNKVSSGEGKLWATVGDWDGPVQGEFFNKVHAHYLALFDKQLHRLDQIIERFR